MVAATETDSYRGIVPALDPLAGRPRGQHIPSLDGFRGFATLAVMAYHLLRAGDSAFWPIVLLQRVIGIGWVGVDLFFVLSGYLITGILCDSLRIEGGLKIFYTRRVLRIFPLYYLVVLFAILFPRLLGIHWAGLQWVYLLDWQNNLPLMRPRQSDLQALAHLWSLGLEEQFYLLWPAVLFTFRNQRKLLLGMLVLYALAPVIRLGFFLHGAPIAALYGTTCCRYDALILGSCLALGRRKGFAHLLDSVAPQAFVFTVIPLSLLALYLHSFRTENPVIATIGFTVVDLAGASLLLLALRPGTRVSRMFSVRSLRWVGTYSYGLYVFHELFAALIIPVREHIDVRHSKLLGVVGAGAIVTLLSFGVAVLSYHFFELPILRLKKHFRYGQPFGKGSPAIEI